jgi:predicted nucleic acid-binding protein
VSLWVLDTSVVAKWLLPEEGSDRAAPYLDAVAGGEGEVAVPSSLFYEMSNLLWVRRRDGLDAATADALLAGLSRLPLAVHRQQLLARPALALAHELAISPSDAAFVVLARDLGCELITADRRLWSLAHGACPWVKML